MTVCLFASDLHGRADRYEKLFRAIRADQPSAVFLGGDLLPPVLGVPESSGHRGDDFVCGFLMRALEKLREEMGDHYPQIFVILGNDDPRIEEVAILDLAAAGLWRYVHDRSVALAGHRVYGYAYTPPSPFQLKDWERYDVSRYVDPGCVSPEQGWRTVPVAPNVAKYATIWQDLQALAAEHRLGDAVFLFHAPPYQTKLDRAALDDQMVDHVPLDVHVGSIAVRRFIEERQPLVTLHGHVHESPRLTGAWRDRIGGTYLFSGAHDGPELALVRFELENVEGATRELI